MGNIIDNIRQSWKAHKPKTKKEKQQLQSRSDFYSLFLKKGDVCFDVGANVGNRVEVFLNLGAKVVAIEPQETCYKILSKRFKNKIQLVTKGLGKEEGVEKFHISNATTISSFSEDWIESVRDDRFKGYEWNETREVEMTTLDKLIERYQAPVLIKIDVEGYEYEVLQGLSQPIDLISIEYTVPEQTDKSISCIEYLYALDNESRFNYSVGESMSFAQQDWLTKDEMINIMKSQDFIDTQFGDIYIRQNLTNQ